MEVEDGHQEAEDRRVWRTPNRTRNFSENGLRRVWARPSCCISARVPKWCPSGLRPTHCTLTPDARRDVSCSILPVWCGAHDDSKGPQSRRGLVAHVPAEPGMPRRRRPQAGHRVPAARFQGNHVLLDMQAICPASVTALEPHRRLVGSPSCDVQFLAVVVSGRPGGGPRPPHSLLTPHPPAACAGSGSDAPGAGASCSSASPRRARPLGLQVSPDGHRLRPAAVARRSQVGLEKGKAPCPSLNAKRGQAVRVGHRDEREVNPRDGRRLSPRRDNRSSPAGQAGPSPGPAGSPRGPCRARRADLHSHQRASQALRPISRTAIR